MVDDLVEETFREGRTEEEDRSGIPNLTELENLYRSAFVPVWNTDDTVSSISIISTVVVILTMCTIHGVSNAFADELLRYLSSSLLPKGNSLPTSFYQAKTMVRKMGLDYNVIHCCPVGHVLFRGEKENLDACPHPGCG
jgi:hypothetical protein